MKASVALPLLATLLLATTAVHPAIGQQTALYPAMAACGAGPANYDVKHDPTPSTTQSVPPGKALVYIIEMMPDYPFVTKKVNIGLDGTWLGATDAQSYMSFAIDPGVHHLCAVYQGHAATIDE